MKFFPSMAKSICEQQVFNGNLPPLYMLHHDSMMMTSDARHQDRPPVCLKDHSTSLPFCHKNAYFLGTEHVDVSLPVSGESHPTLHIHNHLFFWMSKSSLLETSLTTSSHDFYMVP